MKLITNEQVPELITIHDAVASMRQAFGSMATGAQQTRMRTVAGPVMLSTMGAVLPGSGVAGAKIYTTINGQFRFVIVLFSTDDGRPLAAIEADAMTGLRTAAATAVATDYLARQDVATLSIIGTGVQARSHVPALLSVRPFREILVAGIEGQEEFAREASRLSGVPARAVGIEEAVREADVLLTVTRSAVPLFSGDLLSPGTFVAAVGASKGSVRELDDRAIARAAALVVEWKPQAQQEAGDLLLCQPGIVEWDKVWELAQVADRSIGYIPNADDIVIYKAIGVGMEDVALAGLVYRRARERFGW